MKFLIQVLATIILCFIFQYFLPWWTMAVGAFYMGYYFKNKPYVSFLAGLISAGLLWFGMAYYIDVETQSILTQKINKLLPVNSLLMTVIIGSLVGGLASFTGTLTAGLRD